MNSDTFVECAPFDHTDPQDILCEHFRKEVLQLMLDADKITLFRELTGHEKMAVFMAGILTGLIGAMFACVQPEGKDHIMRAIIAALPEARSQADGVEENSRARRR